MAIVKGTYTRKAVSAKASIRYIQHRPGKDGTRATRVLFGLDGAMGRWQAYTLIDRAEKGSHFYRFIISPDPNQEDSRKDLFLRDITEKTMEYLGEQFNAPVAWVAAEHNDHAPHRHVHIVAVVPRRLAVQELQALRQIATTASLAQRRERDVLREQRKELEEGRGWE